MDYGLITLSISMSTAVTSAKGSEQLRRMHPASVPRHVVILSLVGPSPNNQFRKRTLPWSAVP